MARYHAEGIACVIGDPTFGATSRVRSLTPELSKGLEFDLVVLVDPDAFGEGIEGAVDRYVAMTRATQQLVILTELVTVGGRRGRRPPTTGRLVLRALDRVDRVGESLTSAGRGRAAHPHVRRVERRSAVRRLAWWRHLPWSST